MARISQIRLGNDVDTEGIELGVYDADPSGVLTAPRGSFAIDIATPQLLLNKDGLNSGWISVQPASMLATALAAGAEHAWDFDAADLPGGDPANLSTVVGFPDKGLVPTSQPWVKSTAGPAPVTSSASALTGCVGKIGYGLHLVQITQAPPWVGDGDVSWALLFTSTQNSDAASNVFCSCCNDAIGNSGLAGQWNLQQIAPQWYFIDHQAVGHYQNPAPVTRGAGDAQPIFMFVTWNVGTTQLKFTFRQNGGAETTYTYTAADRAVPHALPWYSSLGYNGTDGMRPYWHHASTYDHVLSTAERNAFYAVLGWAAI